MGLKALLFVFENISIYLLHLGLLYLCLASNQLDKLHHVYQYIGMLEPNEVFHQRL